MNIDPTAIVESGAKIGADVKIGPFCKVGGDVTLGDGVQLLSHVVVDGTTSIGDETIIHPFAVLGGPPQHLAYEGVPTKLMVGVRNIIREHVTMNIGTPEGGGETVVGDGGMFMAACHVAHDCKIGNRVVFANNATLGGHVSVGNNAFLGGLCAVHQFCRVGDNAFVGGCAAAPTDIIPFGSAKGNHAFLSGLNIVGLKRQGMDRESIHALRAAYRILFEGDGKFRDRVDEAEASHGQFAEVRMVIDFIKADSRRPIMMSER